MKKDLLQTSNIIIEGVKIYDPVIDDSYRADLYIKDSFIIKIEKGAGNIDIPEDMKDKNVLIDGEGLLLTISFFDMHAHFRDPGKESDENIKSGLLSAYRGGITKALSMPNTEPVIDKPYLVEYQKKKASSFDFELYPTAAITKSLEGRSITEFGLLKDSGAVGLSDDGKGVNDPKLMYEALRYARSFGILLILHEEDENFSTNGLVHEGKYSNALGLEGISTLSEEIPIIRDIYMAKKTGAKIHITHVSSRGSVEIIRKAKEDGVDVTCDATPHHIYFNDSCLIGYNADFKVKPPIRSTSDQEAIIQGIKDGTIDTIASDHAPHKSINKDISFKEALFGAVGFETLFKASYTKLCLGEKLDLNDLLKMITIKPAQILEIQTDNIKKGIKPSLVLIDLERKSKYSKNEIVSMSKNSPFDGEDLHSEIVCTINKGKLVFVNDYYNERFICQD